MADTILIIRHAEKPEPGGDTAVDATGAPDSKSLTPRGWQRSGAWAELFAPSLGRPVLPMPTAVFASAPASHKEIAAGGGGSKSRRPLETISPFAAKLGIEVDLRFGKGDEADLATAISTTKGVALVCWQHEDIVAIATAIVPLDPKGPGIPAHWPGTCFNVIFRFDRADSASPWVFQQVVPVMLKGDSPQEL
jgi:hypothetical protein